MIFPRFGALSRPIGCFSVYSFIMDLYGIFILPALIFVLPLTIASRLTILTIMILYSVIGLEIFKLKGKFKVISNDRIPLSSTYNASFDQPSNNTNTTTTKSDPLHITELHDSEPFSINRTTSFSIKRTTSHKRHPSSKITLNTKQSPISFRHYLVMPLIFFIILLATWVPLTINRVYAFIHPDQEPYPLLVSVGAMGSLRGFWNGILFVTMGVKGWRRQKRMERRLFDSARSSVY